MRWGRAGLWAAVWAFASGVLATALLLQSFALGKQVEELSTLLQAQRREVALLPTLEAKARAAKAKGVLPLSFDPAFWFLRIAEDAKRTHLVLVSLSEGGATAQGSARAVALDLQLSGSVTRLPTFLRLLEGTGDVVVDTVGASGTQATVSLEVLVRGPINATP